MSSRPIARAQTNAPVSNPGRPSIGRLAKVTSQEIRVEFEGSRGAVPARVVSQVDLRQLRVALRSRQPVLIVFEQGDCSHPIVVGVVCDRPEPSRSAPVGLVKLPVQEESVSALVDGKEVRVVGHQQVVLECGAASITLRQDGRVIIRGAHVETHASGTNRIKGAQVRIN